ncbi:hemin uptake protein HemP [Alicycliphilus denitrificans]|uniref:hemin uptake protein HemP n=1 Tax=Alicycliphilus denitrificans TaxID=179636 RepID=UPI0001D9ED2F|nr:hemin uptake protein HemP [Alicycliphilus denitrificans]ADV00256.1 Hemin uptake protein hemP [Alicycliphilus denitrificans BC]GAO21998.1 hemin uptake protein hemp [Alicycliphilus sp. B1]
MHAELTIPSAPTASHLRNTGNAAVGYFNSPADMHAGGMAVDSKTLLRGHKAVTIVHNGASYRLQATKLGKLILTK